MGAGRSSARSPWEKFLCPYSEALEIATGRGTRGAEFCPRPVAPGKAQIPEASPAKSTPDAKPAIPAMASGAPAIASAARAETEAGPAVAATAAKQSEEQKEGRAYTANLG
jgi:hypothetical protein